MGVKFPLHSQEPEGLIRLRGWGGVIRRATTGLGDKEDVKLEEQTKPHEATLVQPKAGS